MSDTLGDPWGLPALQQRLQAVEPDLRLELVASIASTNSALLERATALRAHGHNSAAPPFPACILVAQAQTQGRGRQGRAWHAQPGASLTFSLALTLAPRDWSGLSLAVGVALAEALDPAPAETAPPPAPRIGLKWPNDLWLRDASVPGGGRKLGGVLIESCGWAIAEAAAAAPAAEATRPVPRVCVIGVGLNVGPQGVEGASSGVAWLQELRPQATAAQALACVALPLLQAVRRFEQAGFAGVAGAFARRDLLQGQAVSTTLAGLRTGTAQGVDAVGALRVRAPDGTLRAVIGGEVTVRPLGENHA